jgi:hypothetical protein
MFEHISAAEWISDLLTNRHPSSTASVYQQQQQQQQANFKRSFVEYVSDLEMYT